MKKRIIEDIDESGIGGEPSSDEVEMLSYFMKKMKEETMVPISRFDNSKEVLCKCGEVVWLFKDSELCPKCKEVLFK